MSIDGALALVGLGLKAGSIVVGTSGVREALQQSKLTLVVVPSDASARTEDKVLRLARATGVPLAVVPTAVALGNSVGRTSVQAVGIRDRRLAEGIVSKLSKKGR